MFQALTLTLHFFFCPMAQASCQVKASAYFSLSLPYTCGVVFSAWCQGLGARRCAIYKEQHHGPDRPRPRPRSRRPDRPTEPPDPTEHDLPKGYQVRFWSVSPSYEKTTQALVDRCES
eukprot:2092922-Prymnesium_polylepis.1